MRSGKGEVLMILEKTDVSCRKRAFRRWVEWVVSIGKVSVRSIGCQMTVWIQEGTQFR